MLLFFTVQREDTHRATIKSLNSRWALQGLVKINCENCLLRIITKGKN